MCLGWIPEEMVFTHTQLRSPSLSSGLAEGKRGEKEGSRSDSGDPIISQWYLWTFSTRLARASSSPQKAGGWCSAVGKPIQYDCPCLRLLNCLPAPRIPSPNLTAGDSNHSWQKQQAQKQQLRARPEASKHHSSAHVKRVPLDPRTTTSG